MLIRTLIALAALAALTDCSSEQPLPPPAEMGKSIRVEHVRVQYAAAFAPGVTDLPASEATRLNAFLDQAGMLPGDRAFVAAAPGDPLASQRTGRIASLLARHGLGAEPVPPPPGLDPNHVAVLVDRYVAIPPACPDWSDDPAGSHSNSVTSSNYGCATLSNFAQMIANPRDLTTGRQLGPEAGDPAADAVERYRTGAVKPLSSGASSSSSGASGGASSSSGGSSGMSASAGSSPAPSQ
ncbi:MAG TPA: CpaD family pilus assembly lipoprotein [Stellaceae bacterium]|nr:CpaD family pilus assembly lipoprotein [Stellaceae bacterium]